MPDESPSSSMSSKPVSQGIEARRAGRLRPARLTCDLGRVVDISAMGARIRCKGQPSLAPGALFQLVIHAPAAPISVACCLVWKRKIAWRRWEVGVRFVEITPEVRSGLNLLARGIAAESELSHDADSELM